MQADFLRSLEHWKAATARLADPDQIAPPQAWRSLEHYLGVSLRQALSSTVNRTQGAIQQLERELRSSTTPRDPAYWQQQLVTVRHLYLRAETTVDFYSDCLASRSIPKLAALLRACDHIATRAMAEGLAPMGRPVPATLSFVDSGVGASIVRAGLRLWDGTTENVCATVKLTRLNLLRGTSALHECGHQVHHQLNWIPELADALKTQIGDDTIGARFAEWASEIGADAYAHVLAGFGAAAALHDVLDGASSTVFAMIPFDPHPVSVLRCEMVFQFCRHTYGDGPWNAMSVSWLRKHPLSAAPQELREFFEESIRLMPRIVHVVLSTPYRAFGNRPLTALIDPQRVSPLSLEQLSRDAGKSAFTSTYWTWNEAIRLLALTSYRAGENQERLLESLQMQEAFMLRLGAQRTVAA